MMSRVMVRGKGAARPSRSIVIVTFVPGSPRRSLTASLLVKSKVDSPSISTIRSPPWIPIRKAGVPSIGETTVGKWSRVEIVMPSPPNSPSVLVIRSS